MGSVPPNFGHRLVIDGLLGTGATGAPRGSVEEAIALIERLRANGATVVSLDVPSGVDATTGRCLGRRVTADLTLTFGTLKRGILTARDQCGAVAVLDIGLGHYAACDARRRSSMPLLARVLGEYGDAHKGNRTRLAIVGGAVGRGRVVLAAAPPRAARRHGQAGRRCESLPSCRRPSHRARDCLARRRRAARRDRGWPTGCYRAGLGPPQTRRLLSESSALAGSGCSKRRHATCRRRRRRARRSPRRTCGLVDATSGGVRKALRSRRRRGPRIAIRHRMHARQAL